MSLSLFDLVPTDRVSGSKRLLLDDGRSLVLAPSNTSASKPVGKWEQDILIASGKAALLHDWSFRQDARDSNLVVKTAVDHRLLLGMRCSLDNYVLKGKIAENINTEQPHPMGKRPGAMLEALLFRLAPYW